MYFATSKIVEELISLVASEQVTSFEVQRLQQVLPSKRWRSTSLTPFLVGQFDKLYTVDFCSLLYANAINTDWARHRFATSEANLTNGSAVVDVNDYIYPGTSGKFFGVYSFIGTGGVDFTDVLDQALASFSIQIRIKRTTTATQEAVVSKKASFGISSGFNIEVASDDKVSVSIADGVAEFSRVSDAIASNSLFETYTMVVDRSADELLLYRGETLQGIALDISSCGSLTVAQSLRLARIGAISDQVDVDEFRFFSAALVPADLAAGGKADVNEELDVLNLDASVKLYWRANRDNTTALDESGEGNNGTITNGTYSNTAPGVFPDLISQEYGYVHQRSVIANPVEANWFRIDFDFTGNPDGFVQAAQLMLAVRKLVENKYRSPVINDQSRAASEVGLAAGGIDIIPGTWKGDNSFTMTTTDDEYLSKIEPMLRERNAAKTMLISLRDDEITYPMHYLRYGRFSVAAVQSLFATSHKRFVGRIVEP